MISTPSRRRVTSQHCAFNRCWCASEFIEVSAGYKEGVYNIKDDQGRVWMGGADLIETHTEDAPLTRWERLSGVDT